MREISVYICVIRGSKFMHRVLFTLVTFLALCQVAAAGPAAENGSSVKSKFPSPDGRFALRIALPAEGESGEPKIDLIEKQSGKVMVDLGTVFRSHLSDTVLVWSADSKRVAYGTREDKEGEVSVYFWNGSAFQEVPLPDNLPSPDIKFGKGAGDDVKNYGGAPTPLRWL